MRALHALNAGLWAVNGAVSAFWAHSTALVILALLGLAISTVMWKLEP